MGEACVYLSSYPLPPPDHRHTLHRTCLIRVLTLGKFKHFLRVGFVIMYTNGYDKIRCSRSNIILEKRI